MKTQTCRMAEALPDHIGRQSHANSFLESRWHHSVWAF